MDVNASMNIKEGDNIFNEEEVLSRPWVQQLLKHNLEIARENTLKWCNTLTTIGDDYIDVERYTAIYKEEIGSSYLELYHDLQQLQKKVLDDIEEALQKMVKLCKDLEVPVPKYPNNNLSLCKERQIVLKLVEELEAKAESRRVEARLLDNKQKILCKILGRQLMHIPESYILNADELAKLAKYIEELEEDKFSRDERFLHLKCEISEIVDELKLEPTMEFERQILAQSDTQFMVTEENMKRLESYYDNLVKRQKSVREEVQELRKKVDDLWNILEEDVYARDDFRQKYTGNSLDTLEALRNEMKRLEALKKANIKNFVEKLRVELSKLWELCQCDGQQRNEFQFLYTDVYTEDLLELHELEVAKWQKYYQQNKELLGLISEHDRLWHELLDFERTTEGPKRYQNRGGQLLKEEKLRNKLMKKIPEKEEQLLALADEFQVRTGVPFRVLGITVQEHLNRLHEDRDKEKKLKLSARKQQRDQTLTPAGRSRMNLFPSTPMSGMKSKLMTPLSEFGISKRPMMLAKATLSVKANRDNTINAVRVQPSRAKRLSQERKRIVKKCQKVQRIAELRRSKGNTTLEEKENIDRHNTSVMTEYDSFEEHLSNRADCRSTLFRQNTETLLKTPSRPRGNLRTPAKVTTLQDRFMSKK